MKVAIVDYGSGNLHSAHKAFERAARQAAVPANIKLTPDPDAVFRADAIVLPGVGAFADCKRGLEALSGMTEALNEAVRAKGRPFLGICVGMQLLATRGLEHGDTPGLGWIEGVIDAIAPADPALRIPHMGWNTLDLARAHPVLRNIPTGEKGLHAYFRPFLCVPAGASGQRHCGSRLRRRDQRLDRARHHHRLAISS